MPRPIKSPMQPKPGSPLFLVKLAADLLKVHRDFLSKVDEFISETRSFSVKAQKVDEANRDAKAIATDVRAQMERILNLPRGEDGHTPTVSELLALIRPLIPAPIKGDTGDAADPVDEEAIAARVLSLIPVPKDGESPALDMIVTAVIEELKANDNLKLEERFKRVHNDVASYRNQLAGKVYGKDTWARGGGSGSTTSGKSVTTQYVLTAVQAGNDVTIDLTQLTNWATFDQLICVYRNNVPQTEGAAYNFTKSGATVTIFNAASDEIFNITYSYV